MAKSISCCRSVENDNKSHCCGAKNRLVLVAIGTLIGFLLCMSYVVWVFAVKVLVQSDSSQNIYNDAYSNTTDNILDYNPNPETDPNDSLRETKTNNKSDKKTKDFQHKRRRSLYVGVLTLGPYLNSRATACNETWGQSDKIDKLEFYADVGDSRPPSTVGLVSLPDSKSVDAWHTEKAFKMLEHMCEHHLDQYDWFLRAVDDSYINVERMYSLLDKIDKTKSLMLGHTTFPIEDASYKALNGRGYCLSGPGLVFSRPFLKSLCPSLAQCEKTLSHLPADVAIAKCASETTGLECTFVPELQPYFTNTYEKNQFHLLDKFTQSTRAITYHPLKSPWMMRSLHVHIMNKRVQEAVVQLEQLISSKAKLTSLSQHDDNPTHDSQDSIAELEPSSLTQPSNSRDIVTDNLVFMTNDGHVLTSEECEPSYKQEESEEQALKEAVIYAQASVQWTYLQSCKQVLSAYSTYNKDQTTTIVDLMCQRHGNTSQTSTSLTRTVMTKTLSEPFLKQHKTWKTSRHLIVLVEANLNDLNFVNFVLRLYHTSMKMDQRLVLSVIQQSSDELDYDNKVKNGHQSNDHRQNPSYLVNNINSIKGSSTNTNRNNPKMETKDYDTAPKFPMPEIYKKKQNSDEHYHKIREKHEEERESSHYLLKDLKHWYGSAGIELHIHSISDSITKNQRSSRSRNKKTDNRKFQSAVYNEVLLKLSRKYPDATVFISSVKVTFDEVFIQRCGDIVKQGRQVYNPRPVRNKTNYTDVLHNTVPSSSASTRPLCIHIKDFLPEKESKRKRRNKHRKGEQESRLAVNTAIDANLHAVL